MMKRFKSLPLCSKLLLLLAASNMADAYASASRADYASAIWLFIPALILCVVVVLDAFDFWKNDKGGDPPTFNRRSFGW